MISAPLTGCTCSSFARRVSAGGHVEQPSEVNNSTRTGVRLVCDVCATPVAVKQTKTPNKAVAMAKERSRDMNATSATLEPRSKFKLRTYSKRDRRHTLLPVHFFV